MEERQAEQVHAVCRRGISTTLDQMGDQIYCLKCFYDLKGQLHILAPGESSRCGGEYQWVTKADLEAKKADCASCGESIIIEPTLKI